MKAIDFTSMPRRKKAYDGANGNKISILYNGAQYMLKFSSRATKNDDMSYSNSCFSEYLGCHIYNIIGLPVQETILGTYAVRGDVRTVVACSDFTEPGIVLQDFASMKNQIIDSERNGYGTELDDVITALHEQSAIEHGIVLERFWDMFIIDALIGNWDRHNGNWGFLYNTVTDEIKLAPVYDCGSCLYQQADERLMSDIMSDKSKMNYRIYEIPTSALTSGGKRIKYFDFISSLSNEDCNMALQRIVPKINMGRIQQVILDMPLASDIQKKFYLRMLEERKRCILDHSMALLQKRKNNDLEAVRRNGLELQNIKNPTAEMCVEAVKQNPEAIAFVKDVTLRETLRNVFSL